MISLTCFLHGHSAVWAAPACIFAYWGSLQWNWWNSCKICLFLPVVLHGNNLLVFGGTGIPFGESNGNDVHVCNVKYKRWALFNCRGKKPNRIYGQVLTD